MSKRSLLVAESESCDAEAGEAGDGDPPRRSRPQTTPAQLEAETRSYAKKKAARGESLASAPSELTEKVDQPSSSLLADEVLEGAHAVQTHVGVVVFACASCRDSPTDALV